MKASDLVFQPGKRALTHLPTVFTDGFSLTRVSQRLRRIDDPGTHAWVWTANAKRKNHRFELVVSRAFGPLGNLEDETFVFDTKADPLSFHAVLTQFEPDPVPEEITDDGNVDVPSGRRDRGDRRRVSVRRMLDGI